MIGDLTKEQGLDKILVENEGGKMSEEELDIEILKKILCAKKYNWTPRTLTDQILALIREAGYNQCSKCALFIEEFGEVGEP